VLLTRLFSSCSGFISLLPLSLVACQTLRCISVRHTNLVSNSTHSDAEGETKRGIGEQRNAREETLLSLSLSLFLSSRRCHYSEVGLPFGPLVLVPLKLSCKFIIETRRNLARGTHASTWPFRAGQVRKKGKKCVDSVRSIRQNIEKRFYRILRQQWIESNLLNTTF